MTRYIDRGALIASGIGAGMAVVIVIALELILAVQPLVMLAAAPAGIVIGAYANVRARRHRPRLRVMGNALWAGGITGLTLAGLYVALRLLFVYADTGVLPNQARLDCAPGPACAYARFVDAGHGDELAAMGITGAASFEAAIVAELVGHGFQLFALTTGGALFAGCVQALSGWSRRREHEDAAQEREPAPA